MTVLERQGQVDSRIDYGLMHSYKTDSSSNPLPLLKVQDVEFGKNFVSIYGHNGLIGRMIRIYNIKTDQLSIQFFDWDSKKNVVSPLHCSASGKPVGWILKRGEDVEYLIEGKSLVGIRLLKNLVMRNTPLMDVGDYIGEGSYIKW
jgi:hypothetical protein